MASLGDKIRSGSAWLLSANAVGRILEFLFGVALARLLVPADFGMLVTIQVFTGLAGLVAGGGLGQALIQAKEVDQRHFRVVFTAQLLIGILIYLVFFSIAPWFPVWFGDPLYADLLRVSALTFLLRPLTNIPTMKLSREYRFRDLAFVQFLRPIFSGGASVSLALYNMGPWSLVLGGLVGAVLGLVPLYWLARWRPGIYWDNLIARQLGGYGFKFSINDILVYVKTQAPNLVISRVLGASPLGLFNKASSLGLLPLQLMAAPVGKTLFRGLSQVREDRDLSRYMYLRTVTLLSAYMFPFYVGIWWLAEPFLLVVYGEKWVGAARVLEIMAIAGIIRVVMRPAGPLIAAQNRLGKEIRIHLESLLLLIVGVVYVVDMGIEAVGWVMVGMYAYTTLRMVALAIECVGARLKHFLQALIPSTGLSVLLFCVCAGVHFGVFHGDVMGAPLMYGLVMGITGALVYAGGFLFLPIPALASEAARIKKIMRVANT